MAHQGQATFEIHVWVSGASGQHAYERLRTVEEYMEGLASPTGGGHGWPAYHRWRERSGKNPLAQEGEHYISDATFRKTVQVNSSSEAAALAIALQSDIECAADFPIAVEVDFVHYDPPVSEITQAGADREDDPNRRILVVMTEQEHAILLACLRRTARKGGLEGTGEADIATNGGQWKVPGPDEIDGVGDRFVMDAVVARDVRL